MDLVSRSSAGLGPGRVDSDTEQEQRRYYVDGTNDEALEDMVFRLLGFRVRVLGFSV